MSIENYTNARRDLRTLITRVNNDYEPVVITTKEENAVLISEKEYNSMKETMYLTQNPTNAKRLRESIEQEKRSELIEMEVNINA